MQEGHAASGARHGTQRTIALVGNPNSGKTCLFNALTGHTQRTGNWPGVTVEKKVGSITLDGEKVPFVDLPGIYALLASSDDERVARDYILSGEPALVVDIVDAANLQRNLFLTTQLIDMKVPLVVVVNMMDVAESRGISIDLDELSHRLGCPVVGITATHKKSARRALAVIEEAWHKRSQPATDVRQLSAVEELVSTWEPALSETASRLGTNGRWLALKLLERDDWATDKVIAAGVLTHADIDREIAALEDELGESADVAIAESRYAFIEAATSDSVSRTDPHADTAPETVSDKIDRVVLNRWLGIPIFLAAMYLLFWFAINIGGSFIDFFDIVAGAIFVDGLASLLEGIGSPDWLINVLAYGVGGGIQTVATFIPVIFFMFLGLSILEDSGYMARAAFVMDRLLRWVGLPGKSIVPMLVGFGCNVPAIMATRTLETRRERYLTMFMNPFISCGARLPVFAVFGVAFWGAASGAITFSLYAVGVIVAILTGLLLKNTLFKGEPSHFVMELPSYHAPRVGAVFSHSWRRTLVFMTRAKYIIPIVLLLVVLNAVGTDGTFGNEDSESSALSAIGKGVTPVFEPMGVKEDNWEATVGIFSGILAKEAVVATMSSLYSQEAAEAAEELSFWGSIRDGFVSIPEALAGVPATLIDPLGLALVSSDEGAVAEEVEAGPGLFAGLRAGFSEGGAQAYAYLLFTLLYIPCVAAWAALTREMGLKYTLLATLSIFVTAWSIATFFYQVTLGGSVLWIVLSLLFMALVGLLFWWIGRRRQPLETRLEQLKPAEGKTIC